MGTDFRPMATATAGSIGQGPMFAFVGNFARVFAIIPNVGGPPTMAQHKGRHAKLALLRPPKMPE
jgi:hypothetical protein